jgi:hypothetical protein
MTRRPAATAQLPDLTLGTRFPTRLLNAFPAAWKRRHMVKATGGEREPDSVAFSDHLRTTRRLLLTWSDHDIEILQAFPAARALVNALPPETECIHLCEASQAPLVQGLFPNPVLTWQRETLAWHDEPMRALVASLKKFAPDTALAFALRPFPTVLQAALRASGARARIGWEQALDAPFVNTRLRPDEATPNAARFFQCLDLWRYAGFTPRGQWTYLQPDIGRHEEALGEWTMRRATPETTWLFVQDADKVNALDAALFETLHAHVSARETGPFTLGAVLWNPRQKAVARHGRWLDAPVFNETDFSALLAALDGARGVIGPHSFALHFASLTDVRTVALLDPSEARHNAAGLNPRFEAVLPTP